MDPIDEGVATPPSARGDVTVLRRAQTCIKPYTARSHITEPATCRKMRQSGGVGEAVKVFVRIKPLTSEDLAKHQGRNAEALCLSELDGKRTLTVPGLSKKNEHRYTDFEDILTEATNQEVFKTVCQAPIEQVLKGYNATILAYGQTGSGKTYTMFGRNENATRQETSEYGMLQLAMHHVDSALGVGSSRARVSVSVFEVYNEELFVLLDETGVKKTRLQRPMSDFHATKPMIMTSVASAVAQMTAALALRTQDSTVRNVSSSRSHAMVRITIEQPPAMSLASSDTSPDRRKGLAASLFLVDLAGSESILHSCSSQQASETININKSLAALERVISCLAGREKHVPYRDSVLTQVLQEGLDPRNAHVAVVATVSRFEDDLTVTRGTLGFAQRARNVRTFAQVTSAAPKKDLSSSVDDLQRKLQEAVACNNQLRQELANFKEDSGAQSRAYRQVAELQRQLDDLVSARDQQLRKLLDEVQAEKEARMAMEQRALDGESKADELASELWFLKQNASVAEDRANAEHTRVAELEMQVLELNMKVSKADGAVAGAISRAEQLQAAQAVLQDELVAAQQQLTKLKGQLAAEGASSGERVQQAEAAAVGVRAELEQAEAEAAQLRAELEEARRASAAEIATLKEELAAAQAAVESMEQQLAAEQQSSQQHACAVAQLEEELAASRKQLELLEQHKMAGSGEQLRLRESLQLADATTKELQGRLAEAEAGAAMKEQAAEALRRRVEQLEAEARQHAQRAEALELEAKAAAETLDEQGRAALARAEAAEAEVAGLRRQLADQATAAQAALAAAVQEARQASEASAASRMVPLKTECERLQATCTQSEMQLSRLQTECERLRKESAEAVERERQLRAEAAALSAEKEAAQRQAAERISKLEAQIANDVAPRRDAKLQAEERVKQLEAQLTADAVKYKGELELKDRLVRKLQLITEKQEQQLNELRNGCDTTAAMSSDQQAYAAGSPFGPAVSGSRSEVLAASPGVDDVNTPMSKGTPPAPRHTPPSGVAFLSRTTTQGAAALRRNNKPGFGTPGAVTPPPAVPRSMSTAAANATVNTGGDDAVTPISAVRASAGGSEGGAPETPGIDVSPLDPELLKLVTQPRSQMDICYGVRSSLNRMN